jgi:hemerythrin
MGPSLQPDFIQWQERYSVGNPDLDRQHQSIIALINRYNHGSRLFVSFRDSWGRN